jgi:hypothetical protein
MHLRRGAENWLDQRPGNSWQGVEAALEFVADKTADGNIVDRIRRTKEPHHGCPVSAAVGRAPEEKPGAGNSNPISSSDLFAIHGTGLYRCMSARSITAPERDELRTICRLDPLQQRHMRAFVPAPVPTRLVSSMQTEIC